MAACDSSVDDGSHSSAATDTNNSVDNGKEDNSNPADVADTATTLDVVPEPDTTIRTREQVCENLLEYERQWKLQDNPQVLLDVYVELSTDIEKGCETQLDAPLIFGDEIVTLPGTDMPLFASTNQTVTGGTITGELRDEDSFLKLLIHDGPNEYVYCFVEAVP